MGEPIYLWVVSDDVKDASRRERVRDVLRFAGNVVRPGVTEIVTTETRIKALMREFSMLLAAEDDLRVYRVCANCRTETVIFGEGKLAKPPSVIIV